MLMSRDAFERIPSESQQALRTAAAKMELRIEDLGLKQDQQLRGGLFVRQGPQSLPVSPQFRHEFEEAVVTGVREAERKMPPNAPIPPRLDRILTWLWEYREGHAR
jgi:hypothetical protein